MKPTLIIAEAGVNHNGDLTIAKKLIDVAAGVGADYVKFQTFKAEKLVSKDAPKAAYQHKGSSDRESQYDMIKRLELDIDAHTVLIAHCKKKKIRFLSTAFDLESIDLLDDLGIDLYKIPSGEITNLPYLKKIASKRKPIILSTGMCFLGEIEAAIEVLLKNNTIREDLVVLHCNTDYPTSMQDVNLMAMTSLSKAFNVSVGYSDHTMGIEVPIAAVALGAVCIEKHFTLDRSMEGPDHVASLEPEELKQMIEGIRNVERALGSSVKRPSDSEIKNRVIARKSIHVSHDLKASHILSECDLEMKRPGSGICPMQIKSILGRKLNKNISKGNMLGFADLL